MAGAYLYGWVSTELPGYREIETDDGVQTAAPDVYEFRDWVAALDAAGTATVAFDSATGLVTATPANGALTWPDAAADALGFGAEPVTIHPVDGAVTAPFHSMLAIPLLGCKWERVAATREAFDGIDRMRRANGYTFGFSRVFTVALTMDRPAFDAFKRGWVHHGRVTIEAADTNPVGAAAPGGTLIGTVLSIDSSGFIGPRHDIVDVRISVAEESGALPDDPWQRALALGYGIQLEAVMDGIRPTMTESLEHRLDAGGLTAASGVSQALVIDGQTMSWEIDRDTGVAGGRSIELTYAYDQLDAEGLGDLFRRPDNIARLTANLEAGDTTCTVDDTTGFDASGTIYVGREVIDYSGVTATTFTGLTRAVAGYEQRHMASAIGIYAEATDRVSIWRGRLVSLWAHLLSPDGRLLEASWDNGETEASTRRIEWRGFISEPPAPSGSGMRLVCQVIERAFDRPIGSDIEFTSLPDASQFTQATPGEALTVIVTYDWQEANQNLTPREFVLTAPIVGATGQIVSFDEWAQLVENELRADLVAQLAAASGTSQVGAVSVTFSYVATAAWFSLRMSSDIANVRGLGVEVASTVPWLNVGDIIVTGDRARLISSIGSRSGTWLVLQVETDDNIIEIPEAGLLLCLAGDSREVIRYDGAIVVGNRVLMHVSGRHVSTTRYHGDSITIGLIPGVTGIDLTDPDLVCHLVFGFAGTVGESALTVLESSGTGLRGTFDTELLAVGLGIPSDWIDEEAILAPSVGSTEVFMFASSLTSAQDMIGGWYAIHRRAFVSRRVAGLGYVLTVVQTEPSPGPELSVDTIALSATATPRLIEAANTVKVDSGGTTLEEFVTTVIDRPRVQQEGEIVSSFSAPGMTRIGALASATSLLRRGLGQATIDIVWPSWADPRPGDPVTVTLAHPRTWDWETGTRSPTSLSGRIMSVRRNMDTWAVTGEILLEGRLGPSVFVCPTAFARTGTTGNSLFIDVEDAPSFALLEEITLYTPGNELVEFSDHTIIGVDEEAGDLTINPSLPGWVTINETRVTFARFGLGSTRQQDGFSFVRTDREWS